MNNDRWASIIYVAMMIVGVALATIPAALALGLAIRVFLWAAGLA